MTRQIATVVASACLLAWVPQARADEPQALDRGAPSRQLESVHTAFRIDSRKIGHLVTHLDVTEQRPGIPIGQTSRFRSPRCSVGKGLGIGAAIGGGVGLVGGALAPSASDFGGRALPLIVYGSLGAGVGALVGYLVCSR